MIRKNQWLKALDNLSKIILSLALLFNPPLMELRLSSDQSPAPVVTDSQFFLPLIAGASQGPSRSDQPGPVETNEAALEFDALRAYLSLYPLTPLQQTDFSEWRRYVWDWTGDKFDVDTSYYRTLCNTATVAALVQSKEGNNPNVDSDRAKTLLLQVMAEYADNPETNRDRDGWGFPDPNTAELEFHTGFVGYPCTMAAALLWDGLNNTQKATVKRVLGDLADRVATYDRFSQIACDNSPAEEASAFAAFLAALSQFDRSDARASGWLARAQELMAYALTPASLNIRQNCPPPPGDGYIDTVTNHGMYPHPTYAFSVLNDIARALLPWQAQGVTLHANPALHPRQTAVRIRSDWTTLTYGLPTSEGYNHFHTEGSYAFARFSSTNNPAALKAFSNNTQLPRERTG